MKVHQKLDKQPKKDVSAFGHVAKRIHRFHLAPMISLPDSGIEQISRRGILAVAFVGGTFSGFLGGGAGYKTRHWLRSCQRKLPTAYEGRRTWVQGLKSVRLWPRRLE